MNESSLKYAAYKSMLEGNITRDQYEFINEVGALKMLGSGIKNFIKSLKTGAEAVKTAYDADQYDSVKQFAKDEIKKVVSQVTKIGKKLNQNEAEIAGVLSAVLQDALKFSGIEPRALTAVQQMGVADGAEAQAGQQAPANVISAPANPNEPASGQLAAVQNARLAAVVSGRPASAGEEKLEEKDPTAGEVMEYLYTAVTNASSQSEEDVKKVVDYITKNKIKLTESMRFTRRNYVLLAESISRTNRKRPENSYVVVERWQALAGMRQLFEGDVGDQIAQEIANNKIKDISALQDALRGASHEIKWDDARDIRAAWNRKFGEDSLKEFDKAWEKIAKGEGAPGAAVVDDANITDQDKAAIKSLPAKAQAALEDMLTKKIVDKVPAIKILSVLVKAVKKVESQTS